MAVSVNNGKHPTVKLLTVHNQLIKENKLQKKKKHTCPETPTFVEDKDHGG